MRDYDFDPKHLRPTEYVCAVVGERLERPESRYRLSSGTLKLNCIMRGETC